jgi:hypothetical protein
MGMKHRLRVFGVIMASGSIGCGVPPTLPTTLPTWDGQVQVVGAVRDFGTDTGIEGARVIIGTMSATTDVAGFYSLTVLTGEYNVTVDDVPMGMVRMRDRTYRGDFYLNVAGCIGRYGNVLDSQTSRPVSGATVSIYGPVPPATTTTDSAGTFKLSYGCAGSVCVGFNTVYVRITHPSYVDGLFGTGRGVCFVSRRDYELVRR